MFHSYSGVMSATDHTPDDDLLAAVRDEVLAYGVTRATATSIANRAGVSRVTVYRRGGGIKQLVLDALVHEFRMTMADVVLRVADEVKPATGLESIVAIGTELVDTLSHAPLVAALLQHDPELLLPYLVDRHGRSQLLLLDAMTAAVAEGVADGTVRDAEPELLAVVLLHALTPFVVGTRILGTGHHREAVRREVRHLIESYLAPTP